MSPEHITFVWQVAAGGVTLLATFIAWRDKVRKAGTDAETAVKVAEEARSIVMARGVDRDDFEEIKKQGEETRRAIQDLRSTMGLHVTKVAVLEANQSETTKRLDAIARQVSDMRDSSIEGNVLLRQVLDRLGKNPS